jgi:CubicO group peptidase (beta-lactamase class C family)
MTVTNIHPGVPAEQVLAGAPPAGVTDAIHTMMRTSNIPGLSLAVVNPGGLLFAGGYGLANRVTHAPAVASTAYLWFSMTKIVTATAALRLADEGRLDLSAPAGAYVDYLRAPGNTQPTVRQLLNHTAGLGNPLPIRWAHPAGAPAPDPEALLRRLMGRRRAYRFPVGESARYSNVGYLAAGQIIAAAAGMPFEAYVRECVLRPLAMERTGFGPPAGPDPATGYLKAPRIADPLVRRLLPGGIAGDRHGRFLALNPFAVDGPAYGGLTGDVLDAGRFLRMHLRDGELDGHHPPDAHHRPGRKTLRSRDRLVPPAHQGPRPVGGTSRHRSRLLERHAPLPGPRTRCRGHEQQHGRVRLRAALRAPGRCVMVVIAVIAVARGVRALMHRRAAAAARAGLPSSD